MGEANGENHDWGLEFRRIYDVVYDFWVESRRQEDLAGTTPSRRGWVALLGDPGPVFSPLGPDTDLPGAGDRRPVWEQILYFGPVWNP